VNHQKSPDRALLMITHFPRILETVHPDVVHVLSGGRIVKSGGMDLAVELEERGYDWLKPEAAGRA
jgi:Fe-S cluster assembly ATP-binding protein